VWGKPETCLHQVTSPLFLKEADLSKLRTTFEAAIVIVIGVGGG